jgi:hypothetical protein
MTTRIYRTALLSLLVITLSACAGSKNKEIQQDTRLTPIPATKAVNDPSNSIFMNAIANYVTAKKAPNNSRYEFTRIDLNGDGRREGIVLMKSPHKYWCEEYGCYMAVFEAHNSGFTLLSEITPVRGPLTVLDEENNGWRNIMARVSGRSGWDAKNVVLRFDGKTYPQQPAYQPSVQYSWNDMSGTRIFP